MLLFIFVIKDVFFELIWENEKRGSIITQPIRWRSKRSNRRRIKSRKEMAIHIPHAIPILLPHLHHSHLFPPLQYPRKILPARNHQQLPDANDSPVIPPPQLLHLLLLPLWLVHRPAPPPMASLSLKQLGGGGHGRPAAGVPGHRPRPGRAAPPGRVGFRALASGGFRAEPDLSVTVNGLNMPNPFVIGSGPPGTNYTVMKRAFDEGWGAVIAKTVSSLASPMMPTLVYFSSLARFELGDLPRSRVPFRPRKSAPSLSECLPEVRIFVKLSVSDG